MVSNSEISNATIVKKFLTLVELSIQNRGDSIDGFMLPDIQSRQLHFRDAHDPTTVPAVSEHYMIGTDGTDDCCVLYPIRPQSSFNLAALTQIDFTVERIAYDKNRDVLRVVGWDDDFHAKDACAYIQDVHAALFTGRGVQRHLERAEVLHFRPNR